MTRARNVADIIKQPFTTTLGTSNYRAGVNAGNSIAAGTNFNVIIGDEAGTTLNSGDSNVAVGVAALNAASSGSNNVAVGTNAMRDLTTGTLNVAVGENAMFNGIVTGNSNIAMGYLPLQVLTGGIGNIAIGRAALGTLTSGNNSVAIGYEALNVNNNSEITSVGNFSGSVSTGAEQVFVGYSAGKFVTTGASQTFVGHNAGKGITGAKLTASNNTAIGKSAGLLLQGAAADNTLVGKGSGQAITTGKRNSFLGTNSGVSYTTGEDSVAIGNDAAKFATTAHSSVFIGADAGQGITGAKLTGNQNTCVGAQAGFLLQGVAANNNLFGFGAGKAITTAAHNVCVGVNAGAGVTTGDSNVLLGGGIAQNAALTGDNNIVIGDSAGEQMTSANNNIFIGLSTGVSSVAVTTGASNILIGKQARVNAADGANQITLGEQVTCVGNNNFTFGNGSTDSNIQFGANSINVPSDERYKEDIATSTAGLSFIKDLRPVTFKWKKEKDVPSGHDAYVEGSDTRVMLSNGETNHGFIAQEVKAVIDNHSEIKDGFGMWTVDERDTTNGRQRLADGALVPILVKAIQELEARIATLEG